MTVGGFEVDVGAAEGGGDEGGGFGDDLGHELHVGGAVAGEFDGVGGAFGFEFEGVGAAVVDGGGFFDELAEQDLDLVEDLDAVGAECLDLDPVGLFDGHGGGSSSPAVAGMWLLV